MSSTSQRHVAANGGTTLAKQRAHKPAANLSHPRPNMVKKPTRRHTFLSQKDLHRTRKPAFLSHKDLYHTPHYHNGFDVAPYLSNHSLLNNNYSSNGIAYNYYDNNGYASNHYNNHNGGLDHYDDNDVVGSRYDQNGVAPKYFDYNGVGAYTSQESLTRSVSDLYGKGGAAGHQAAQSLHRQRGREGSNPLPYSEGGFMRTWPRFDTALSWKHRQTDPTFFYWDFCSSEFLSGKYCLTSPKWLQGGDFPNDVSVGWLRRQLCGFDKYISRKPSSVVVLSTFRTRGAVVAYQTRRQKVPGSSSSAHTALSLYSRYLLKFNIRKKLNILAKMLLFIVSKTLIIVKSCQIKNVHPVHIQYTFL